MIELPQVPAVRGMAGVAIVAQTAFVVIILLMATHAVGAGASELVANMAALARHDAMQSHQREAGEVVVELIDPFPAVGDVTGGAHLHIRILMNVIRGMTGGAIAWQIILQGADMAVGTSQCLVVTSERKAGLFGVIKRRLFPADGGMTGLTLLAVATQVNVAICMATVAGHWRVLLDYTVGVAGAARQFRVMVPKRKIGSVVVENALVPAVHGVAGLTLLAVFAGVNVGGLVAADTSGFFKLITLSGMTAAAGHLAVLSLEIKAGGGVVELLALLPALR